ncbi:glyoxylate/hydroxypyruvate reductase A [Azospirillum sp. SYSU D00513]|uniref:2-hydroxyacid dehydrogenase n=1 Tax=Azospirillum sp. SYSU D00513 TaxID=2812561 RepID=UPI001A95B730|nr:glyoxylate/hydroxypyruvate reductase A [Azospirillum sp. SYSU D00513]
MTLLFCSTSDNADRWVGELRKRAPNLEVRVWPEMGDPAEIDYALVWKPPHGLLAGLPNLKLIVSLGAGVEALLLDPTLPQVPLVRMVTDGLTLDMAGYVAMQVLRWERKLDAYAELQKAGRWEPLGHRPASEVGIGILGLGELGVASARTLASMDYRVMGWSRSPKTVSGVESFTGEEGLHAMLGQSDLLVCLLPLTEDTRDILNAELFARLPKGAVVINAARGGHLAEADLIPAIDRGHLAGASLDVFADEPLPPGHPFWAHPRIHVTPHIAGITHPSRAAETVVEAIRLFEAGQPLKNVVDRAKGY